MLSRHTIALPRGLAALAVIGILLAAAALSFAPAARAQEIKAWVPPDADSLLTWATEARTHFRANQGDSIGGSNFRAYEIVGDMGRRLVRALGRRNIVQAHVIQSVLDSLGLDTEVVTDPSTPVMVMLMVRNPFSLTAHAVGFFYWYQGNRLHLQGAVFFGGHEPRMRVWYTGHAEAPYLAGVVDKTRDRHMRLLLLSLSPQGTYWNLIQYGPDAPMLGGPGEATWVDMNGDNVPELVTWVQLEPDSIFDVCPSCPKLVSERIYTLRPEGFTLHDSRLVPSPFATLTLFVRLLEQGHEDAARRLLARPSKLREAVADGWGEPLHAGGWRIVNAEQDQAWPRWLEAHLEGPRGEKRYLIRFALEEGRWIISDWQPAARAPGAAQAKGAR